MREIQRFALQNIYCAPSQDYQYRFSLIRATKKGYPANRTVNIYNDVKSLPNVTSKFHVYIAGNIPLTLLNLLRKNKNWLRDKWYNLQEDMNARNLLVQVYDREGRTIPRVNIYYTCTHNDGLILAIEIDYLIDKLFDVENACYVRFYSNEYFTTDMFKTGTSPVGIHCESKLVLSNQDKVNLQNKIKQLELAGGKTLIYVNGYYADSVSLHIPNNSLVEFVYDNSLVSKEVYKISDLRTFDSVKDNKLKYLLFRPRLLDSIQYEDDTEVYITSKIDYQTKGLYYYQHRDYALTNVTDKDFALFTGFVNNQAQTLSDIVGGGITDKEITILTRRSSGNRSLIYSSLKLHELYKLPDGIEYDIISNTNNTLTELRAEQLENSDYFKMVSVNHLKDITPELATSAVGYNGAMYYFGKTPEKLSLTQSVNVPFLYQKESIAYEYNSAGTLLSHKPSIGSICVVSPETKYLEFLQGEGSNYPSVLYRTNEVIPLREAEYRILIAQYEDIQRISTWTDITDDSSCVYDGNSVTVNDSDLKRVRVFYFDRPVIKDLELAHVDGTLVFPITVWEDRGDGYQNYLLDLPYDNLEVFLNGKRLTYKVDFFLDFPYIGICNKTHIDYTLEKQKIHIRLSGYNLDKEKINSREIRGFVSHGVLTRNNYYDIREDRVFSTYINGKLVDNATLRFSEEDAVVRLADPLNGLPYSMTEHMVSLKELTGLSTIPYFNNNLSLNKKISDLYNSVYPEPKITETNVIADHYYLYSPVVSKVIHDLLDGNISASIYTSPYNDTTINDMLANHYKLELKLDPISADLPANTVVIHPHFGNTTISVNIYQYRFIANLVRILTKGHPDRINLSGYLEINTETVEVNQDNAAPGGIVIL